MQDFAHQLASQVNQSKSDVMGDHNLSSEDNLSSEASAVGKHLSSKDLDFLNDDQLLQLHELHQEATKPPTHS